MSSQKTKITQQSSRIVTTDASNSLLMTSILRIKTKRSNLGKQVKQVTNPPSLPDIPQCQARDITLH